MRPFDFVRPESVEEALQLKSANPASRFLAGGTNLIDLMKYEVEDADQLIDVTRLPLDRIDPLPDGGLRIGALVRNSDLAANSRIAASYPLLSQALLAGASPQLRNMATTGGNLLQRTRCYYFYDTAFPCNKRAPGSGCSAIGGHNRIHAILGQSDACIATHQSDMAVAMAALGAIVRVSSTDGARSIPILELHRLPGDTPQTDTTLQPNELIVAVDLPPATAGAKSKYLKLRDRASYAFALVSTAVMLDIDAGRIRDVRIALGGVAHKPWRALAAEQHLRGQPPSSSLFREAAETAMHRAAGYKDNEFKIQLAKRSVTRVLSELSGIRA
jgi:xanthine dehydrogenase YagS FAD-binding subunit